MRLVKLVLLTGLLCAALSAGYLASQAKDNKAEVALQAAIKTETVDGNLKGAIEQYQKLANGGNHAVAAKALVRMGQCYEKLGDTQARQAYEQVLREFADQAGAATEARARLAALAGTTAAASASTRVDRRVWGGPDAEAADHVSPDGSFLSFTDWNTGNLAIHDFATAQNRNVTNKGSWATSWEEAGSSVVSPDSKQIAYYWYNKDGYCDLRVIGIDGLKPRVLYANAERLTYIMPMAWSPDGRQVLADFTKADGTHEVVLVAVADGSTRVVKATGKDGSSSWVFSPDGRYIAHGLQGNISLFEPGTGRDFPLIQDGGTPSVLGWAPDGRHILFSSARSGARDAWLIEVAGGKAVGEPQLLKKDFSGYELGFARSSAFYYSVTNLARDVQIAELDATSGKLVTPPQPASRRWVGITRSPDWSPDGKSLAYVKDRPPAQSIVIRATETGEDRELQVGALRLGSAVRWTPDGKGILATAFERGKDWTLVRVDAQTAEVTSLTPWTSGNGGFPRFDVSRDGKTIFVAQPSLSDDNPGSVTARDLQSGRETTLLRGKGLSFVSVSPDGQRLAIVAGDNKTQILSVLPVGGGDAREIARVDGDEANWRVAAAWTPDGRHVVFVKGLKGRSTRNVQLWRVPAEGGQPQQLGLTVDELWWLRLHPDGRHVAVGASQSKSETWVMENFLPAPKAAKH
jgi:Tol biopolymer transport system component